MGPLSVWQGLGVGWAMGSNVSTIVVESRSLVREALKSLMANTSYRVVCGVGYIAELAATAVSDERKLVILGARSADNAVTDADEVRKLWPHSKIVLLYEQASEADLQKLLQSEINGCVPLFVSSDILIGTLDTVVERDVHVVIACHAESRIRPARQHKSRQSDVKITDLQPETCEYKAMPDGSRDVRHLSAMRQHLKLSEREGQVLKGLVKGHPNKVIAREWDIAKSTVKVHMKSILRKIGVGNRTQAAIWARESGYAAADEKAI